MTDVREIKLNMRYPESRQEDITDAFTRGYTGAVEISNKAIKKLEAENAELRKDMKDLEACYQILCDRLGRDYGLWVKAEAENDKLRELVKDMWPHVRHRSRMCGECELPCDTSDECLLYEPMRQRMRGLGIKVDE